MSVCLSVSVCLSFPTVQTIGINCAYCTESPPIIYIYIYDKENDICMCSYEIFSLLVYFSSSLLSSSV